jgi:hypothetical protein
VHVWCAYDFHKMHVFMMCMMFTKRCMHSWCVYDAYNMLVFLMCVWCSQKDACMPDVCTMFTNDVRAMFTKKHHVVYRDRACLMCVWCSQKDAWCVYDVHKKMHAWRVYDVNIMSCIRDRACLMCVWCSQEACMPDVRSMFTKTSCSVGPYAWCVYDVHSMHASLMCVRCWCLMCVRWSQKRHVCIRYRACLMCIRCSQDACLMCVRCSQKDACLMCVRCSQKHHVVYTSPRNPRIPIYRTCLQTTFPARMSIL